MIVNIYYANPNSCSDSNDWKCFTMKNEINVGAGDNITIAIDNYEYLLLINRKNVILDVSGCIIGYDYVCTIQGIRVDKDKMNDEISDMLKCAGFNT